MLVLELASRKEADLWLVGDPQVTGGVWRNIEVWSCRSAPFVLGRAAATVPNA